MPVDPFEAAARREDGEAGWSQVELAISEEIYDVSVNPISPGDPFLYNPELTYPFLDDAVVSGEGVGVTFVPRETEECEPEAIYPWDTDPSCFLPLPAGEWRPRAALQLARETSTDSNRVGTEDVPNISTSGGNEQNAGRAGEEAPVKRPFLVLGNSDNPGKIIFEENNRKRKEKREADKLEGEGEETARERLEQDQAPQEELERGFPSGSNVAEKSDGSQNDQSPFGDIS